MNGSPDELNFRSNGKGNQKKKKRITTRELS